MRKIIFIIFSVIILGFIGRCIYMVACVSCTIPHIKDYEYAGRLTKFESGLHNQIHDHKDISFKNMDTVGDKDTGYAYDINIQFKDSLLYNLRYEAISNNKIVIGLIGALDLKTNKGGYGIKADGMNELLKEFDRRVLRPLKDEQHIELKAK
ncbi:hypothetical protein [Mucilaginibacter boryungensis]